MQVSDELDMEFWNATEDYLKDRQIAYRFLKIESSAVVLQILPEGPNALNQFAKRINEKSGTHLFIVSHENTPHFEVANHISRDLIEVSMLSLAIPTMEFAAAAYKTNPTASSVIRDLSVLHEISHLLIFLEAYDGKRSPFHGAIKPIIKQGKIPRAPVITPPLERSWLQKLRDKILKRFFGDQELAPPIYDDHVSVDELHAFLRQLYQTALVYSKKLKMNRLSREERKESLYELKVLVETLNEVSNNLKYNLLGFLNIIELDHSQILASRVITNKLEDKEILQLDIAYKWQGQELVYSAPLIGMSHNNSDRELDSAFKRQVRWSLRTAEAIHSRISQLRTDIKKASYDAKSLQALYDKIIQAASPSFRRSLEKPLEN